MNEPDTFQNRSEKEIFFEALDKNTPEERAAFLDGACGRDLEWRARVEALLANHFQQDAFMKKPAVEGERPTIRVSPISELSGTVIGRYKLLELIGEGGFGSVWMAEQEEPVRRRVALKVIKPGMDTKQVLARFESERQALAMMDHPSIARVFDGGATDSGRPYFVMELVRGSRITEYCDANKLSMRERLGLFIQVCQAVQHAHQKGIIHRDLKPANILVTEVDGEPVPKVIDFGVAKATQARLTEMTLFTGLHQMIGTPAYMSPEQAGMGALDMDTRSDIYALGVLLYELLTGQTPIKKEDFDKAGMDEIFRLIREQDPPKPSTRLSALTREELTAIASRRQAEPVKLNHLFRGDLDWIVMKALEKDRRRRYETANGLAMDIQRHLGNEPVVARPPSMAYNFQKAFRRHKLGFAAGTAIAAALVLGVIGTTAGLLRAQKQGRVAETARQEQSRLREIAVKSLDGEKEQRTRAEAERTRAEAERTRAEAERLRAETQALAARRNAYSSDMNVAQEALAVNNLRKARLLLNRQRPQPGQTDLRDWEWRYLWNQARADEHEVFLPSSDVEFERLSFSADGRLLAREHGGHLVVVELSSRRTVLERTNTWLPTFTHHGARLAFLVGQLTNNHDSITLLDMATQNETRFETYWGTTKWLGFTPDDSLLLAVVLRPNAESFQGNRQCTLAEWQTDTGQEVWHRPIGRSPATWFTGSYSYDYEWGRPCAISPDGSTFAVCVQDGHTQSTGPKRRQRSVHHQDDHRTIPNRGYVLAGQFHPADERSLARYFHPALGRAHRQGRRFAGRPQQLRKRFALHAGRHTAHRVQRRYDPALELGQTQTGRHSARSSVRNIWAGPVPGRPDPGQRLLGWIGLPLGSGQSIPAPWIPDASWPADLLAGHVHPRQPIHLGVEPGGAVGFWDVSTLKETRRLWPDSTNRHIAISPDAKWVVRVEGKGHLSVWDVTSSLEKTNFVAAPGQLDDVRFTDNGKFLVTLCGPVTNLVLEAWDTDTWQRKSSLGLPAKPDTDQFRPRARVVARTATTLHYKGETDHFTTSLPNSYVIAADGVFRFFDVTKLNESPKIIEALNLQDSADNVLDLAVSPDGRLAAAAYSVETSFRLWDMATRQPVETLKNYRGGISAVAFSCDGRRLAAGSGGAEAIKLWDPETREEVLTLNAEGSEIHGLKFSPDGRYLLGITSWEDYGITGHAHLWFAPTLAEIEAAEAAERQGQHP